MAARDAPESEYEMTHVQRKRAPTQPEAINSDGEQGGRATTESSAWQVVENGTDASNDGSHNDDENDKDDDHKKKMRAPHQKLRMGLVSGRAPPRGCVRRSFSAVLSAQWVVAVGLVWCAVIAMLLFKWLWIYTSVMMPLEKWLGSKLRAEGEPIVVGIAIVAPFVMTGLVFYGFRPSPPRLIASDTSTIAKTLRAWRRHLFGGRMDSVDVIVVIIFLIVQVNTLVGKLFIDQSNGKIATSGYLIRTGRALGMNGFYAVLLSIVLVARRSFVHDFLHLSSERGAKYHVWCGNFGALALAFHGLIYSYCWYVDGKLAESLLPCFDCDAKRVYKSLRNFSGLVAQVMLMVVALMSLERVRRRHFRRFTLVHCLNVVFVVGTCIHYYPAVFWFLAPVLVYVMYRIVSVFTRVRSGVVSARALDDAIVQLQLRRDGLGVGSHDFVPGHYVYIKVDEISKHEWHPLTISSSPLRDHATLSLDIKAQGPFTTRLLHLVRSGSLSTVQLDGYYGTGIQATSDMVLVAGGSGMTPFLSLLEHFVLLSQQEDTVATLPHQLWIVWTARDASLLHAYLPLLEQVRRSSVWKARVWLHWTGIDTTHNEDALEGVGRCALGDKSATISPAARATVRPDVSYTLVFAATVVGAALGMALVFIMPALNSVWWVKRVSLLLTGILGAMAGASTIMWRALPSRAGFERIETSDMDMMVTPRKVVPPVGAAAVGGTPSSLGISRSRPAVNAILREIHAASHTEGDSDVRVLVSGPSELQQCVVDASAAFRSPLLAVECRSFAL